MGSSFESGCCCSASATMARRSVTRMRCSRWRAASGAAARSCMSEARSCSTSAWSAAASAHTGKRCEQRGCAVRRCCTHAQSASCGPRGEARRQARLVAETRTPPPPPAARSSALTCRHEKRMGGPLSPARRSTRRHFGGTAKHEHCTQRCAHFKRLTHHTRFGNESRGSVVHLGVPASRLMRSCNATSTSRCDGMQRGSMWHAALAHCAVAMHCGPHATGAQLAALRRIAATYMAQHG